MPFEWWTTLAIALFFCALSPGSGALFALRTGLKGNLIYATPAIMGLEVGALGVSLIIFTLMGLSIEISPHVLDLIGLCGGLYLIFLGGKDVWNARLPQPSRLTLPNETSSSTSDACEDWKQRFISGTLINITNPKGYLFMIAFISQWIQDSVSWPFHYQALTICYLMFIIDTSVMLGYARFAGFLKTLLHHPLAMRFIQGLLGGVLCSVGFIMGILRFL
jgi:homoserine/homoserine lactone efflux protein